MTGQTSEQSEASCIVQKEISGRLRLFYKVVENCLAQLTEADVWRRESAKDNSIGNLVLHVSGSLQQWIVGAVGGLPTIRDRAAEFGTNGGLTKGQMLKTLYEAIDRSCAVVGQTSIERMAETIRIGDVDRTIAYDLILMVGHTGVHIGQIQMITKNLLKDRYVDTWANPPAPESER